jgi:UDP-3-O-[3-hydroxymyristoyl] glucosamine N-acyltransferase
MSATALDGDPSTAGAVVIAPPEAGPLLHGTAILVDNPRLAFANAVRAFLAPPQPGGIAASAHIDSTALIGEQVVIGEGCVIGSGASIGAETRLLHHVVIGPNVRIGSRCAIGSGTVIGEVGFGLARDEQGHNVRIPHIGGVEIGDEVEIGALSSIAAGTIEPTRIADRAKIDDQVFIAHNCDIGEDVIIIACAEISGSVRIGPRTWVGPNVSIRDRVSVPADSLLGIGATVIKSLEQPGVYIGSPARLMPAKAESD